MTELRDYRRAYEERLDEILRLMYSPGDHSKRILEIFRDITDNLAPAEWGDFMEGVDPALFQSVRADCLNETLRLLVENVNGWMR